MERWGAFSVIDHKNEIKLATELLLYDKIAVPTPADRHGADWKRWEDKGWQPEKLIDIIDRLKPARLVQEVTWDADREASWRKKFEEAKADIERVNADIQRQIDMRVADAQRNFADRSKKELDQAIQLAAFAGTRNEIITHLRGQSKEDKAADFWNGPVEFYAAYQSKADFERLHPDEDAVQKGVEHVNFLIEHRLAVPDEPPEELLDRVIELVTKGEFKRRRREFYDYQISLLREGHKPILVLRDLNRLVKDFNEQTLATGRKHRWENVVNVLAVAGSVASVWTAPDAVGVAGAALSAGPAVWSAVQKRTGVDASGRIAASAAMFHQIEADTGFQFRTTTR